MMLQAKYCDAKGKLKPDYPSFWQFRYFFRQHRDPISESISREGIKAYQRNHRPFTGAVSDYAGTIGTYMTDATVADIYIVSRLSRRPIGRPVIYTMVDAYSRLITGVYVGLEGGQYALRLLAAKHLCGQGFFLSSARLRNRPAGLAEPPPANQNYD